MINAEAASYQLANMTRLADWYDDSVYNPSKQGEIGHILAETFGENEFLDKSWYQLILDHTQIYFFERFRYEWPQICVDQQIIYGIGLGVGPERVKKLSSQVAGIFYYYDPHSPFYGVGFTSYAPSENFAIDRKLAQRLQAELLLEAAQTKNMELPYLKAALAIAHKDGDESTYASDIQIKELKLRKKQFGSSIQMTNEHFSVGMDYCINHRIAPVFFTTPNTFTSPNRNYGMWEFIWLMQYLEANRGRFGPDFHFDRNILPPIFMVIEEELHTKIS